jgi:patatin-like phospholipase/acyl hydrolase
LLALYGGGIRGVITLEILAAIESIVRAKLGSDAVLADYFDYVAGTSTGAIIAACLSAGMSVDDVRQFLCYERSGDVQ